MTPIWQGPLSAGANCLAAALPFGADFLTAGLAAAGAGCVIGPGADCACTNEEIGKHDRRIAAKTTRTMTTRQVRGYLDDLETRACQSHAQDEDASRLSARRYRLLPSVILHHAAARRLELLFLEHKAFTLVPAPGLLIFAHAAQPDF